MVNHFGNLLDLDAYSLAANQNRVLGQAHNFRDVLTGSRATTGGGLYVYNGTVITEPKSAYAFRMTAPTWLAPDPLKDSSYAKLITVGTLPKDNPRYQPGLISWSDWKPITGDNAWAFFVGPLQAAYVHFVRGLGQRFVPFADSSVQNAVAVLPAFAAMQSNGGGVYYAPGGTLQNAGDAAVNSHFVSIENNLSLYAGLRILKVTLAEELARESALTSDQKQVIARSTALIDAMLSGGILPGDRRTKGLAEFLRTRAWHDGEFVQAGYADHATPDGEWRPVFEPKAVDVETWGVAALGSRQIDAWFGFGAAAQMWESLKRWGAYGEARTLWGVGYSDRDGNGQTPEGQFRSGVLSAEWTAGAIVMLRNMIAHYSSIAADSPDAARARDWVVKLRADERSLVLGMRQLQYSRYLKAGFPGKPTAYANLVVEPTSPIASEPYLYSSRRYFVPFGWYGNPLPSTSSTAWAIIIADHYDPFGYGGKPN